MCGPAGRQEALDPFLNSLGLLVPLIPEARPRGIPAQPIKLKVTDLPALASTLKERGCFLTEPISQHDVIYSQKSSKEEFEQSKEGDIIIRLRYLAEGAELNLKQQRSGEMDNLEYETEVKNPAAMRDILLRLGWQSVIEVKKLRRKGKLGKYEICLDEVEGLGSFVELEMLADDDADPAAAREQLFRELESLGLSRAAEETKGYDTQLYQKNLLPQ